MTHANCILESSNASMAVLHAGAAPGFLLPDPRIDRSPLVSFS
jgi:hypothetical protein